jgi:hypothetical protein
MSEELCDGVKMLIERMQTNPEDFSYGGKLHGYRNTMEEVLRCSPADQPMWFLNETEKKALVDGYTAMHKQQFTAGVVQSIFSPEPKEPSTTEYTANLAKSMMNTKHQVVNSILRDEFDKAYAKNRNPRP